MTEENIERLREVYARWAEGDLSAGAELFAGDIVYEPMSDGRESFGREEIPGYLRGFLAQWSSFRIVAEDIAPYGETLLVTERQIATGRSSGVVAEKTFYSIWTFREGRVTSVRWMDDRAAAIEAADGRG